VDYFTKWAEVKALANIRDVDVKKFVWRNIVTRFGVPKSLISNNGLQFDSRAFRKFCNDLGIKNRYSILAYPQSNGQAKASNKVIVNGLKKRLEGTKGRWAEELPNVLSAHHTTFRRSTGETPFSLMYGAKAVILAKVNLCSAQIMGFSPTQNDGLMVEQLDLLEEYQELGMAIFARSAGTRSGPTLMGRILPGSIRNRVGYGFPKKNPKRVRVGSGF